MVNLMSSFRKLSGRHNDSVNRQGIPVPQMTTDMFNVIVTFTYMSFPSYMTYQWVCSKINTTVATSGVRTDYPSGARNIVLFFTCSTGVHVVHCVELHVFMFLVHYCDKCFDFRVQANFFSYLLPFLGSSCF